MRYLTRAAAALAATAGLILAGSGAAAADTEPTHHHHHPGLIGDITIFAPINIHIVDNAIAVLGVAEHDD